MRNINFITFVIADVVSKISAFLLVPILVQDLSVDEYGALGFYLSLIQILTVIIGFSGNGLISVTYVKESKRNAHYIHWVVFNMSFLVFLMLSFLILLYGFVFSPSQAFSIWLCVIIGFLSGVNLHYIALSKCSSRFHLASLSLLFYILVAQVGTFLLFLFFEGGVNERLLFLVGGYLSSAIFFYCAVTDKKRNLFRFFSKKECGKVFQYSFSLYLHHICHWGRFYADKIIVSSLLGFTVGGQYVLASTISSASVMGFTVLSQSLQPFFYRVIKKQGVNRQLMLALAIVPFSAVAQLIFYFIMDAAWERLFDVDYEDAKKYFSILLWAAWFQILYQFFSHSLFYYKLNAMLGMGSVYAFIIYMCLVSLSFIFEGGVEWMIYSSIMSALFLMLYVIFRALNLKEVIHVQN